MHYFVRILYDSDSFHPKRQQGGGECGTSRYVVIRHDTINNEIKIYNSITLSDGIGYSFEETDVPMAAEPEADYS